MKLSIAMYADPGHAWLRVTPEDVYSVGLTRADFTPYSYRDGADKYWYLEEDCDAGIFIRAWEKVKGTKLTYRNFHTNGQSSIRKRPSLLDYRTWDRNAWEKRTKAYEPA